jgi:hypothetical protein
LDCFRRHPTLVLLAMLALTAQVILPFGHVHAVSAQCEQAAIVQAACAGGTQDHCPVPGTNHEKYCPLCAAMGAAGFLLLPTPISLSSLELGGVRIKVRYWESTKPGENPFAFQARGPPSSLHITHRPRPVQALT